MAKYLRAAPMFSPEAIISLPSWPSISLAELNTATRRMRSPDSTLSSSRSTCSGASLMPALSSAADHLALGLGDLLAVELDLLLGLVDVLAQAVDGVGEEARQHAVLGRADLLLAQLDDAVVELADVLAQALDLLLHVDDGHVGDDAERGVEQVADLLLAVLLRLRPQRLHQEVLLGGQLPGLAAVLGGVLQHGVDRLHQALRLLVAGIALARVLLRSGRRGRRRGCRRCACGGGLLAGGRIAPRRGWRAPRRPDATTTVEIEPRTANMEPAPPNAFAGKHGAGIQAFSCLDVVIDGGFSR